ncbi:nucleoside-diphosphate kinase [Mycoplasmatota bacterium WC44]
MFYTFVMFKPDAIERNLIPSILQRFNDKGLKIEYIDFVKVDKEIMAKHYKSKIEQIGMSFYSKIEKSFEGKWVAPVILSSCDSNIINYVKSLIGETFPEDANMGTIRGDFGIDTKKKAEKEKRCCNNIIHASDSKVAYYNEIKMWLNENIIKNFQ